MDILDNSLKIVTAEFGLASLAVFSDKLAGKCYILLLFLTRFVNEAIEEKLARKKAEAEKELEQAYQEIAQDQARWKLTKQWEKVSLKDLRKRLK